jgi:CubicO group peptidase (beta-lactamase class C family)
MTSDHLGVAWGSSSTSPDGSQGWGYGVGVQVRPAGLTRPAGSYGWAGGLGSSWANDPHRRLAGILLTTDAFSGPYPPPAVIQDFWTCAYTALAD